MLQTSPYGDGPPSRRGLAVANLCVPLFVALTMVLTLVGCAPPAQDDRETVTTPSSSAERGAATSAVVDETSSGASKVERLSSQYLGRFLELFPTRATALGRTDRDGDLEDLSEETLDGWLAFNKETSRELELLLADSLSMDAAADARLLRRQALGVVHRLEVRRLPQTYPLFWTRVLGNSGVFLLVRSDRPLTERVKLLELRAAHVPRFVAQAREALSFADPERVSGEIASIAARQARGSSVFFGQVAPAAASEAGVEIGEAFKSASRACRELALFLEELSEEARGTARLGGAYREALGLWTGQDRDPAVVMQEGVAALAEKRKEAADFGRTIWSEVMIGEAPANEAELLKALFGRLSEDRAQDVDEFIRDYQRLVDEAIHFVTDLDLLTLPEFSLITDRSPDFFVGQSVGGVYSPGPYAPSGETLFYLPTPAPEATAAQRDALFRDFNDHFNVMIVPHEIVPGHDTHLRWAARHPSKVRSIFADAVTTEGWGTFSERLLLDLGWGDDLARAAHLKKQLENIARTIVDVGIHTEGWPKDRVLDFVQNEAMQDVQFAENMWQRSLTSAPQLTSYWLGYERFRELHEQARRAQGETFELKIFLDRIMAVAPVGGEDLRALVLSPGEKSAVFEDPSP